MVEILNDVAIDFQILTFTALSVGILDDVLNVRLTLIPPSGLVKFNVWKPTSQLEAPSLFLIKASAAIRSAAVVTLILL